MLAFVLHGCAETAPGTAAADSAQARIANDAAGGVHHGAWSYAGDRGHGNWSALDAEYMACAVGHLQSPIDLGSSAPADLPPLSFRSRTGTGHVINNGHTLQLSVDSGSGSCR